MNRVEFLLARIAEREAVARAAVGEYADATHWQWVDSATDAPIQPDPFVDEYVCDAGTVSLRSVEELRTYEWGGGGTLPTFIIHSAEEVSAPAGLHIARNDPAHVLAQCAADRKIIKWHESWPTLTETPLEVEVDPTDISGMTMRATRQIAWLTEREYVARFGVDPPTAPIIAIMCLPYADHPDYAALT